MCVYKVLGQPLFFYPLIWYSFVFDVKVAQDKCCRGNHNQNCIWQEVIIPMYAYNAYWICRRLRKKVSNHMCNNENLVSAFFGIQHILKYNSRNATVGATWFLFSSQRAYWPNQQAKSSNRIWCTFIIWLTNTVHQINHAVGGPWMSQLFLLHLDNVVHGIVET